MTESPTTLALFARALRQRLPWVLALVLGLALLVSAVRPDRRVVHHEQYARGECGSCHKQAPTYHDEPAWAMNHGRVAPQYASRCGNCHAPATCRECHTRAPQTHTSAFRSPQAHEQDEQNHVYVARTRPAACLVCHTRALDDCATCHALDEVRRLMDRAEPDLTRFRDVLQDQEFMRGGAGSAAAIQERL